MLEIKNVHKEFSGLEVLCGIDLSVEPGERHAIIGPNGAGKTTFFNVISGKYKPSRGRIFFRGTDISGMPPHRITRRGLSRSFQNLNLFGDMTVFENIRSAVQAKNRLLFNMVSRLNAIDRLREASFKIIDAIGLNGYIDVPASELSYGDQRALEIGMSLSSEPELLLLDEPTAGMGSDETRETIELIKRVTEGKTLVIIEHDMDVVFALADRITVLYYGSILITDTPNKIRNNKKVKEVYLGE